MGRPPVPRLRETRHVPCPLRVPVLLQSETERVSEEAAGGGIPPRSAPVSSSWYPGNHSPAPHHLLYTHRKPCGNKTDIAPDLKEFTSPWDRLKDNKHVKKLRD